MFYFTQIFSFSAINHHLTYHIFEFLILHPSVSVLLLMNRAMHKHNQSKNEDKNEDMFSDFPDCVLLHILSFLKAKEAVQTCILSTRWKNLWKRLPTLTLSPSHFTSFNCFTTFVSHILFLRDASTTLHALDIHHEANIERRLLRRFVKYAVSHNVQRLHISLFCDIEHIPSRIFSCQTLTSLHLTVGANIIVQNHSQILSICQH